MEILTAADAASLLTLSPRTLAQLRTDGTGPTYAKIGRRVVYRKIDLERWVEERLARSSSEHGPRVSLKEGRA